MAVLHARVGRGLFITYVDYLVEYSGSTDSFLTVTIELYFPLKYFALGDILPASMYEVEAIWPPTVSELFLKYFVYFVLAVVSSGSSISLFLLF